MSVQTVEDCKWIHSSYDRERASCMWHTCELAYTVHAVHVPACICALCVVVVTVLYMCVCFIADGWPEAQVGRCRTTHSGVQGRPHRDVLVFNKGLSCHPNSDDCNLIL